MVVYVEYALVENFLLDGSLLYLSLKFCRLRVRRIALFLSALTGSVFAVLFPLLPLTGVVAYLVRFAFGCVLCLVVSPVRSVKIMFSLASAMGARFTSRRISPCERTLPTRITLPLPTFRSVITDSGANSPAV